MIVKFIKLYLIPYLSALFILTISGLLFIEYIALPIYVGSKEIYLKDVRGELLYSGKKILNDDGLQVTVVAIPYDEDRRPGEITKMNPGPFRKVKNNRMITLTVVNHEIDIETPDFTGLSLRNAEIEIHRFNLKLDTIIYEFNSEYDNNSVSFQQPKAGRLIKSGNRITLGVSKGNPPDYYIVPDLRGKSLHSAKSMISNSGLKLGSIEYEYYPSFMLNTVIDQSLTEGMRISFPSKIDLILSTDEEP